jgi:Na+/H+ antiporter NhaA
VPGERVKRFSRGHESHPPTNSEYSAFALSTMLPREVSFDGFTISRQFHFDQNDALIAVFFSMVTPSLLAQWQDK